jgi:hypothetical protein
MSNSNNNNNNIQEISEIQNKIVPNDLSEDLSKELKEEKSKKIEYSHERKEKLADRIGRIKNKKQLKKIKKIIFEENPETETIKGSNKNSTLMYFHNFTVKTYLKIEKFLRKIDKLKRRKKRKLQESKNNIYSEVCSTLNYTDTIANTLTDTIATETETDMITESENKGTDYSKNRTRLAYSNDEKRIINKKKYEKDMNISKDDKYLT